MFLFIASSTDKCAKSIEFKYISCSYLSSVRLIKHEHMFYLNTSHVLIYRSAAACGGNSNSFKYISCSYLSLLQPVADCT